MMSCYFTPRQRFNTAVVREQKLGGVRSEKDRLEGPLPKRSRRERAFSREVLPLRLQRRLVRDRFTFVPEARARLGERARWTNSRW